MRRKGKHPAAAPKTKCEEKCSPPYRVTAFYEQQISRNGDYEALRHIVEPSAEELRSDGQLDTSGEHGDTVVLGLQHKYPQTGLLLVTDKCFAFCRFCFRKRILGGHSHETARDYAAVAKYISRHPEMNDIIFSGGDAFALSTGELGAIVDRLLPIPHLKSIRFATKALVYEPQRFDDAELPDLFARILAAGKTPVIVLHVDHPSELSTEARAHILRLRAAGVQFLHQAVLLKGVNDNPPVLARLFAEMHATGVRPYYLFQARPVKGAKHYQVPLRRGLEVVHGAIARLGGLEKTFRFMMSHATGKIEILDLSEDNRLYMRYHRCRDMEKVGRVFSLPYREGARWLDDLPAERGARRSARRPRKGAARTAKGGRR
jgi:lysine 2,3-aminomutase